MVEGRYKVEGIQFIINSTTVLGIDRQNPGISIGTEKVESVHPYLAEYGE